MNKPSRTALYAAEMIEDSLGVCNEYELSKEECANIIDAAMKEERKAANNILGLLLRVEDRWPFSDAEISAAHQEYKKARGEE